MKQLTLIARLAFGAWMFVNGANYLFFSLWPMPTGHEPLAIQLMSALVHSRLLDVAMTIQLVAGALILTGFFVPVALCVLMPISTCALYWSAILDHQPIGAVLAFVAFALNGFLMLAYLDYYRGALQRQPLMLGESPTPHRYFDSLFVNPSGRTPRGPFIAALIVVLAVVAFYAFLVTGRTAQWCLAALMIPAIILHARRLHDMGYSAWLLLAPGILMAATFAIWLGLINFDGMLNTAIPPIALALAAGFALWGCMSTSPGQRTAH